MTFIIIGALIVLVSLLLRKPDQSPPPFLFLGAGLMVGGAISMFIYP